MIELYPHNERAYKKLVESLKTKPLAFIEHATGTGKSFIMLKYLYNVMREKRILIVSMHYEMFEQLMGDNMETLGITKDDFKKLNTMIYHNIIKEDPKKLIEDYDCFIFDEAHHCGAKKWSKIIQELKELVKARDDKKMIGFTATGTRYLDNYLDVSNEFFDGNTVSRLGLAEAILEYLLPAPLYVNSSIKCVNKIDYLLNLLKRVPKNEEIIRLQNSLIELHKKVADSSDVPSLIKKYDIKPGEKYIVFCSSIDDLKEKMREAENWFPYEVKMYSAHSKQSQDKNKQEINDFSNNKIDTCLMFAVDIFNEGFHVDDVDGIFMFRHTVSPIVYLQQIGRALSFSLRKKQIKIFDMVDNISDNDIILELYKEIIDESKRLIKEHPEKREFYEEILSRFQIVDNTNQVMEELTNIEEVIKNKYLIRNQVDQAILSLMEYRSIYPNGDAYQDLYIKKISKTYLSAYGVIIKNRDYLTDEHIVKLNKLNIPFQGVCLDLNVRRQELGNYKNYKELKLAKLKEFIQNYVSFVEENGFRPRKNTIDDVEYTLYKKYREFLDKSSKNQLLQLINANQDSSTVEELVLIGSIPSSDKMNTYLNHIRYNIVNKIDLDPVEVKVFRRIQNAIWIKDEVLLKYIEMDHDYTRKIDLKIQVIEDYKKIIPDEEFQDINIFHYNRELYNALKFIYRHWARVNNEQFRKLRKLNICLPKELDMSWDRRRELLGDYASFYEKEQVEKYGFINKYINFVKTKMVRPSLKSQNEDERNLALNYQDKIYEVGINRIEELVNTLMVFNIPLSIEEKLIRGEYLESDDLINLYHGVLDQINNNGVAGNKEMKILKCLINHPNFLYKEEAKVFVTSHKFAREFYKSLDKLGTDDEHLFLGKIYANYKHLSMPMIKELEKRGVKIPADVVTNVSLLGCYRTLYEQEKIQPLRGKYAYLEYVKKNKRRPHNASLCQNYRNYLATLYNNPLKLVLGEIKKCIGRLSLAEELLLGNIPDNVEALVNDIRNNRENFDALDYRIYKILLENKLIENIFQENIMRDYHFHSSVEKDMFERVVQIIESNPLVDLTKLLESHYLNKVDYNRLKHFQVVYLSENYLRVFYDKVRASKLPLEKCLTKEELNIFKFLINNSDLDDGYKEIIIKINKVSNQNSFIEKKINYQKFLSDYINFIVNHQGIRPSITSEDNDEQDLATVYQKMRYLIELNDVKKIDDAIKMTISKEQEENFFDNFVEFIRINNRFPCNNALDEEEIKLSNTFMNVSKKLTKDQTKYINALRKKVAANTIKMTKEFDRIRKESNNGKKKI